VDPVVFVLDLGLEFYYHKDLLCNSAYHRYQNCNSLKLSPKGIICHILIHGGPHMFFLQIML
jgi:hypothetical protein